jgi:hypothetical protein
VLVSAGQPLFSEDTWWHLAMGAAYAAEGPWLEADPLRHTATEPPAPAAWLADLALHGVERLFGFHGLRAAHALAVAATLGLVWSLLRRAAGSARVASLGTALFAAVSAYRLFQLRPHLLTILATLLLFRLLLEDGRPPSWRRVAAAIALLAVWANVHAAFVLGPALLAAAVAGLVAAAVLQRDERDAHLRRARRLAAALGLGLLATLANPSGARPHGLYFAAGAETPALELVSDEWAPLALLQLPVANLPPSPLTWASAWALLLLTPWATFATLRRGGRSASRPNAPLDPALAALAALSLLALLSAVRFVWLAVFPLLLVGRSARALGVPARVPPAVAAWGAAAAALLLVPAFVRLGDWPMVSRGIRLASYGQPYPPAKHDAHAVWFLADAGLEGNLFNDYPSGNFLGYWLAPRLRAFVNGSLNVPVDVMRARRALVSHRGLEPGESFLELLDRHRVDVFFATGLPSLPRPNRPTLRTTSHLDNAPGWIPVFRNLRSAVYLRDDERNRANLRRVAAHYAREGVAFDPERGFDVARVVREAPRWAEEHGLLPRDVADLEAAANARAPRRRRAARERLAALQATLGLYEQSQAIDRELVAASPPSLPAARRLVWSLLQQGRVAEGGAAAQRLAALAAPDDELSRLLVDVARRRPQLSPEDAAAYTALLPLFTEAEIPGLLAGFQPPEARPPRERGAQPSEARPPRRHGAQPSAAPSFAR